MAESAVEPHNRIGIHYREVPARTVTVTGGIIDIHTHTREPALTQTFVDAARVYGITHIATMAPLEHVDALNEKFPGMFTFIAQPDWMKGTMTEAFISDWMRRLDSFYEKGSRIFKLHMAPGTKERWGHDFDHPMIRRIVKHAYDRGYHFMTHVGDPKAWFCGTGKYAHGKLGTFNQQFVGLDALLAEFPDRAHLGAHMGGCLEDLNQLAARLDRFPHYVIDTSATKWIARAIVEQDAAKVRDFIVKYQDRILFGSDLVVGDKYTWDHYASRYWVHQKMWETDYRDQNPIDDPDGGKGFDPRTGTFETSKADGIPRLAGVKLPPEVLVKIYRTNAEKLIGKIEGKF